MSFLKCITIQCKFLLNTTAKFSQLVVLICSSRRVAEVLSWSGFIILCRCMERFGDQKNGFRDKFRQEKYFKESFEAN